MWLEQLARQDFAPDPRRRVYAEGWDRSCRRSLEGHAAFDLARGRLLDGEKLYSEEETGRVGAGIQLPGKRARPEERARKPRGCDRNLPDLFAGGGLLPGLSPRAEVSKIILRGGERRSAPLSLLVLILIVVSAVIIRASFIGLAGLGLARSLAGITVGIPWSTRPAWSTGSPWISRTTWSAGSTRPAWVTGPTWPTRVFTPLIGTSLRHIARYRSGGRGLVALFLPPKLGAIAGGEDKKGRE